MKRGSYLRSFFPWQSEFDRHYACWANNHRGWQKMKRMNRRLAKKRERRQLRKEMDDWEQMERNWRWQKGGSSSRR